MQPVVQMLRWLAEAGLVLVVTLPNLALVTKIARRNEASRYTGHTLQFKPDWIACRSRYTYLVIMSELVV